MTDPLVLATFQWCNFSAPVILTKVEEMANRGDEARVSILEARMKTVLGQIRRAIETQVFAGSSAILSDLESFNGVDAAAGWFEELAFGSQGNSVGTIGKATYPTSWQNQVADVADDFATNGLIEINKGAIAAKTYAPEGQIDGVFLSLLAYGLLKNELQPQERYGMGDKTQDPGRLILQWNGSDVLTQQDLGFTGSGAANQVSGYGLNSKSLVLYFDKDGRMNLLPPVPVAAAIAYRRDMLVRMQMAASHLASMVMILNAEA